jgi:hypothetical protein
MASCILSFSNLQHLYQFYCARWSNRLLHFPSQQRICQSIQQCFSDAFNVSLYLFFGPPCDRFPTVHHKVASIVDGELHISAVLWMLSVDNIYKNSEIIGGSGNVVSKQDDEGAVDSKSIK